MRSSLIRLEPQTVELPNSLDGQTTLRVTNVSASVLPGLFFCLYNQEKFDIVPENFSLQPSESKSITIRAKLLETERRTAHKEYAYLKSSVVSKRITILIGQQEGVDLGITSSRMTDQQIEASMAGSLTSNRNFEMGEGRSAFQPPRIEQSRFTAVGFEQELENFNNSAKAAELYKQLSQAQAELLELKRKLRTAEGDNDKLKREMESLKKQFEQQGNDTNYKALYEKEKTLYCQLKEELEKIYSQRNVVDVRRKDAEAQLHHRDMRIKHLEHENTQLTVKLVEAEAEGSDLKGRHLKSSKELILRQEQLRHIRGELEHLKEAIDSFEKERVKYIKLEFDNAKLLENNTSLQQQVDRLQASNTQQRQELLKLEAIREHTEQSRDGNDKARQYLSLALESSKIQAETLRMNKQEIERVMQQLMDTEKELAAKLKSKEAQLEQLQRQRLAINGQLMELNQQNSELKQQTRELQTLKAEQSIAKKKLLSAEHKILAMESQLQEAHQQRDQTISKLKRTEADHERYRGDVTRQLDVIKNSTMKEMSKLSSTKAKRSRNEDQQQTVIKDIDKTQQRHLLSSPKTLDNMQSAAKPVSEIDISEEPAAEASSRNRVRSRSSQHLDGLASRRLDELVEVLKVFEIEQRKVCQQLELLDEPSLESPMLKLLSFFRQLEFKLGEMTSSSKQETEYLQQIRRLKFELIDKETALKSLSNVPNKPEQQQSASDKQQKLLQFIQEEMRSQYSRLQTALHFSNEKYEVIKKKVYNEYRFRIVNLLNGKTTDINRLEVLLERFVEGLSNLSHKEAMLHRNSKKHQESLKQNKALRHRIHQLDWLLGEKTTAACTRSPVQVIYAAGTTNENIVESIRCESQLLSCRAELSQVTEELACTAENVNIANQQISNLNETVKRKDDEIAKLKNQFLELERLHKSQLVDALEEMESMRIHSLRVNELEEQLAIQIEKTKGSLGLKEDLNKKKELIKGLKDREKSLVQIIEDIRHFEEQQKNKSDKGRSKEEIRLQEVVADFKERNKELKSELDKKSQSERKLQEELDKKNNQIASMKTTISIKERQLKDQQREDTSKFKSERKQLEAELKDSKASSAKAHRELESLRKRFGQVEVELAECKELSIRLGEDLVVKEKSLMSSIRSLIEILRRVWRSIEIKVRKVRHNAQLGNFQSIVSDPLKIDILRLYDEFQGMLDVIKEPVSISS